METVFLPLSEAIDLATKENIERDQRKGLLPLDIPDETREIYREEATALLNNDGENYEPDYPDHHMIKLERPRGESETMHYRSEG